MTQQLAVLERIQKRCTEVHLYGLTVKEAVMLEAIAYAAIAAAKEEV